MNMNKTTQYRLWADGSITHEDDFAEEDGYMETVGPLYDEYKVITIPDELRDYLENNVREAMTISKAVKTVKPCFATFDLYDLKPCFAHDLPNPSEYRGGDYGKDEEVAS